MQDIPRLTGSEGSIAPKVLKGGAWVFSLRILQEGLRLIRLVILARLLAPSDFGIFAIALLTMSALETFSQTGFNPALVQKKENIEEYLDTVWTVSVIRGVVLFIILYISAPYVAVFFDSPDSYLVIQAIGIAILFQGLANTRLVCLEKKLEYKKLFISHFINILVDFIVVVVAAFILKNVWALVIGMIAGNLMGLMVGYLVYPYKPHFRLDIGRVRGLFSYGKWVLASSVLLFLITQGDDAFVGKYLGITSLGLYQIAYRISNLPTTEISHVISRVTFPAYSRMQDNLSRLRESYLRVLQFTAFLSFPMAGLIFVLASDFTKMFLGEKWMPMVPAMQVLALFGVIRSLGATTGPVFLSIGKPNIVAKIQFAILMLLCIMIYPLSVNWSITGTSLAVLLSGLLPNLFAFVMIARKIECKIYQLVKIIAFSLINTALFMILLFLLKSCLMSLGIMGFILCVMLALMFYIGISYLLDQRFNCGLLDNIKMLIGSRRNPKHDSLSKVL